MSIPLAVRGGVDPSMLGGAAAGGGAPAAPALTGPQDLSQCVDPDPLFGSWQPIARISWTNPGGLTSIDLEWFQDGASLGVVHPSTAATFNEHTFLAQSAGNPSTDVFCKVTFHNAAGSSPTSTSGTTTLFSPC